MLRGANSSDAASARPANRLSASEIADLARVLAEYWVEQMVATFELRAARPPRLWPGRIVEAQRLAAAYVDAADEIEQLGNTIQDLAHAAWPARAAAAAGVSSRPPRAVTATEEVEARQAAITPRIEGDYPRRIDERDAIRDSKGEIEVDLGEL